MEARGGPGLIPEVTDTPTPAPSPPRGSDVYRSVLPDRRQPSPGALWSAGFPVGFPVGTVSNLGVWRGQPGSLVWLGVPSTHETLSFSPENRNRYEGCWRRGMKNGSGRFFHLDHGQLFEGFWVDDVAKCGTMIDFGRDEAPEPTQFPIPKVGSTQQSPVATPERQNTAPPQPHPAWPGPAQPSPAQPGNRQVLFSVRASPQRLAAAHKADSTSKVGSTPKAGSPGLPCSSIQPLTASLQIKILDPDGVLEEALAMFKKTEED